MMMKPNKNRSMIAGGLTSSAGMFISKALGILYVTPFQQMATEANVSYYAYAYSVYDVMLQISLAGIPFAIAALVAKYMAKEDYVTVVLIRKISTGILAFMGFVTALLLLVFAEPIARFVLTEDVSAVSIEKTKSVLVIISLAVFLVPILGSFRGFYQGLKDMSTYAFSQVLEQLSRILFLLSMGFLFVVVFQKDSMWAVYFAVGSAGFSALLSIIHLLFIDKRAYQPILDGASIQTSASADSTLVIKELLYFSVPYFLSTLLGNSVSIVNLLLFNRSMFLISQDEEMIKLLYSMISYNTIKLTIIPTVLASGFSVALIPFMSAAFAENNTVLIRKYIKDILLTITYIALPFSVIFILFAPEIYYVMYGGTNYYLGGLVLSYNSLYALLTAVSPILLSMMMVLRFRKRALMILVVGLVVKAISMTPLIMLTGFAGAIYSNILAGGVMIGLNLAHIHAHYRINFRVFLRQLLLMMVASLGMFMFRFVLHLLRIDLIIHGRFLSFIGLGVFTIVTLMIYLMITDTFGLMEQVLKFNLKTLVRKVIRRAT